MDDIDEGTQMLSAAEVGELTRRYATPNEAVDTYVYGGLSLVANPQWLRSISDEDLGRLMLDEADAKLTQLTQVI